MGVYFESNRAAGSDRVVVGSDCAGVESAVRLEELAKKYCSDKYYAHSYIPFYGSVFMGIEREVKQVLEIGIGYEQMMKPFVPEFVQGSSLKMWRDYFPNATIWGMDNNEEAMDGCRGLERIHTYIGNQGSIWDLLNLVSISGGEFDVVIDDGSHETKDQIITYKTLEPYMRRGGVYVVEDVREPEVVKRAIDGVVYRFNKRPDDCLVVVRR